MRQMTKIVYLHSCRLPTGIIRETNVPPKFDELIAGTIDQSCSIGERDGACSATGVHVGPSPLLHLSFPWRHIVSTLPTFPNPGLIRTKLSLMWHIPFFSLLFFFLPPPPFLLSQSPPNHNYVALSLFQIGWGQGCCHHHHPPKNILLK